MGAGAFHASRYWRIVTLLSISVGLLLIQTPLSGPSVRAEAAPTSSSWNNAVTCRAVITTIEDIIGNGSYTSGSFRPGIADKRSTSPPCLVSGNLAFVEVHNVEIVQYSLAHEDYALYPNGNFSDTTMTLQDPSCPFANATRCRIFVEIDRAWKSAGIAPADPLPTTDVDVQGFVYWNSAAVGAAWHSYTGWEIHPITATRPAGEFFPTTLGTFFWTTLILGIAFGALLILFIYRWRVSPRNKMTVSLAFPGDWPAARGVSSDAQLLQFLEKSSGAKNASTGIDSKPRHDWNQHLTLSLVTLSTLLGMILGWDYANNVYARDWVSQHLAEVSLVTVTMILTVVLLPAGIILANRFLKNRKT